MAEKRLIATYDVFEFRNNLSWKYVVKRLIATYDVFEYISKNRKQ